jgi:hypothetical protein
VMMMFYTHACLLIPASFCAYIYIYIYIYRGRICHFIVKAFTLVFTMILRVQSLFFYATFFTVTIKYVIWPWFQFTDKQYQPLRYK